MHRHIYISVVSHGHSDWIIKLKALERLQCCESITVLCRDNLGESRLSDYCEEFRITYIKNNKPYGFAKNNNLNYQAAVEIGLQSQDYFLLYNPDIDISKDAIEQLVVACENGSFELATVNLFLNARRSCYDDNLRLYPALSTFFKNYLLKDRSTVVDKENLTKLNNIDYWASGAFLLFKAELYQQLEGLDETYYLYCEDIDICKRALKLGHRVEFFSNIEAIHYRQCKSRKFLSREFFLHVESILKYSLAKWNLRSFKSGLVK